MNSSIIWADFTQTSSKGLKDFSVQKCCVSLYIAIVSFSFSFCCFTVLMLCRLAMRAYGWMLQNPTLSRPPGVVVF
jgi:hypothetical protein